MAFKNNLKTVRLRHRINKLGSKWIIGWYK